MIDHLSVGVADIKASTSFYEPVLASLGYKKLAETEGFAAYGKDRISFLTMLPADGGEQSFGNGVHIAFTASSEADVFAFHKAALANGGACEGQPGPRPVYGEGACATYVRDPYGNKLEAISGGFGA